MKAVKDVPRLLAGELRWAWRWYPARCIALVTSVAVFVAAKAGVVVPEQSIVHAVAYVLPILLGGEATHRRVTPVR